MRGCIMCPSLDGALDTLAYPASRPISLHLYGECLNVSLNNIWHSRLLRVHVEADVEGTSVGFAFTYPRQGGRSQV